MDCQHARIPVERRGFPQDSFGILRQGPFLKKKEKYDANRVDANETLERKWIEEADKGGDGKVRISV